MGFAASVPVTQRNEACSSPSRKVGELVGHMSTERRECSVERCAGGQDTAQNNYLQT